MANEFWNVIVGIISGIIMGMVIHSALGHTWGKRLWEIFHRDETPPCYGKHDECLIPDLSKCKHISGCYIKCHGSIG